MNDEEAVSPVIAVILMVAITVVLAATVFVLVQDVGSNTSKTQPSVGWAESEVDDQWDVNQAPQQIEYQAYQLKLGTADLEVSAQKSGGTDIVLTDEYQALEDDWGTMTGGDAIQFCYNGMDPVPDVKVTLLHTESNSVANEYTFLLVDTPC